ncbi:MAG: hypothetical protein R2838_06320 [Caldilineaceae bacterium]
METLCADLAIPGWHLRLDRGRDSRRGGQGQGGLHEGNPIVLTDGELAAIPTQAL